jgi:NADH-quinone oxidoreductase subunit C
MAKETALSRRVAKGKADAEKIFPILKEKFGAAIVGENLKEVDPYLVVRPDAVVDLARFCRQDERLKFDLLSCISGVDYLPAKDGEAAGGAGGAQPGTIEVVYMLDSTEHKHRLVFKARLPRENPRVPSVEKVWRAADWHEREVFDLLGVHFEGHPKLVRILCAEDWEGHPLRKDYVIPERYHGLKNIVY